MTSYNGWTPLPVVLHSIDTLSREALHDMFIGPCMCGATHNWNDWQVTFIYDEGSDS